MDSEISEIFLAQSTKKLQEMDDYVELCLDKLSDDEIWIRGGRNENSVGNLILHLCGNVRQWIVAGVGGEADIRDRDQEFAASGGLTASELKSRLREIVEQASAVIKAVTPARLTETITPQSRSVSVLEAIYQVVGHFQQHAGQILFATKLLKGEDLGFTKLAPRNR